MLDDDPAHPAAAPAGLSLRLAGEPAMQCSTAPHPVPLNHRDAALLAWLAIEGPTPRARLAALIWPDSALDTARNALRQRVFRLRKLASTDVVAGSDTVSLADGVAHDLADSDDVLGARRDEIGGAFGLWLTQQRERRRLRLRQGLVELSDMAEGAKDYADALTHATELLALAPLSEDAHRRVMRLHYLAGDRAGALVAFDRCEQLLKDEVGATPSPETLALLRTIDQALAAPGASRVAQRQPVSVLRPPRLVGRDRECAALEHGWQSGHVVALIGEAGMGKTRLLEAFMALNPGVVRAPGRPGDAGVPLATLARLLRAVMAVDASGGASGAIGLAAAQLTAANRTELTRVLPELDAAAPQTHAALRPLPGLGEGQRLAMQRAVRSLLDSRGGLAGLVVDDLHFADEASLDMLGALIDEDHASGAARRWILACRPAEALPAVRALLDGLADQARLLALPLAPLSLAALAELVDSLGLPGVRGPALAPGLLQRTGGNPLFVLETLKQAWVEQTLGELSDAAAWPRPQSVGRLIERRIAQLSPGALALARVAGVAGVDFSIALAEQVLQVPAMALADAVVELEAAQVMREDSFAHDLVADAVQGSVPASVAVHTHAQVATWLEQHRGEPARIAGHWIAARQDLRAVPWLQQAADAARRGVRPRELIGFLERKSAIEAAADQREAAFTSLHAAAEAAISAGADPAQGEDLCNRLDSLASTPEHTVLALLLRAGMHCQAGQSAAAVTQGQRALALAQSTGQDGLAMQCHQVLADAHGMASQYPQSVAHGQACIAWTDAHEAEDVRAHAHGALALALDNMGQRADALPEHELSVALAIGAGDLGQASVACCNLARNRVFEGRLQAADAALARGEALLAAFEGEASHLPMLRMLRAWTLCCNGRLADGLASAEGALQLARSLQPGHVALAAVRLASCWWLLGQWARVKRVLDEVAAPKQHGLAVRVGHARLSWAYAQAMQLGARQAQQHRQELAEVMAGIGPGERPDLRLPLALELADPSEPLAALAQIDQVREEAEAIGHGNVVLGARLRAAEIARHCDLPRARREALAALALHAQGVQSTAVQPAALWLHAGRALHEAGDRAHAAEVAQAGAAWVRGAAQDGVAAEFRDGFLHRNPVNSELLALAARAGVA
jgi:DNA-binding SARP family transcriptional activator